MRTYTFIFASAICAMLLASCNEKKAEPDVVDNEILQFQTEQERKSEIIKLGDFTDQDKKEGRGHVYQYTIKRTAIDSVGVVTNEEGYRAYDNTISLNVQRDGAQLYQSVFTRSMFKNMIPANEYMQYVLMNIVADRVVPEGIRFIATVGDAASGGEVYVQFALLVTDNGTVSITPHEMFDEEEIDRFSDDGV